MFYLGLTFFVISLLLKAYYLFASAKSLDNDPESEQRKRVKAINRVSFLLLGVAMLLMYFGRIQVE